jgi:thioredoxin reductase (NADPH)
MHVARYARQVTILVRADSLARSMSEYLIREIEATSNITVRLQTETTDGHGSGHLESLTLHDRLHGRTEHLPAAALFVLIGGEPRTHWLPGSIQLQRGYILTGRDVVREGAHRSRWPRDRPPLSLETSMPGVSLRETPATARSSAWPRPSVTVRPWCASRRNTSPPNMRTNSR